MNAEHNQMGQAGSLAEKRNGFNHEVTENAEDGAERSQAKAVENAKEEKNAELDLAPESAENTEREQNHGLARGDARPPEMAGSQPAIRQIGNLRHEPVDGRALLDELRGTIRRFVVLPPHAAETLALWILHTYAFELRKVTTYIGVASPEKRCGKTTLLGMLTDLVNRPIGAANISPPALFRAIEENRPTLLIDEADTFLATNEELRGILNSGYNRKGAYVMRVGSKAVSSSPLYPPYERNDWFEGETRPQAKDGSRLVRFSCWCPKVIAAIGRLPDTLPDRCIVITMQRKRSDEQCERLRELEPLPLRQRCARFVRENEVEIAKARPEIPAALNDRAGDIWEPLFVLADLAGGDWPKLAREAAVHLSGTAQETSSAASLLFADIKLMFTVTGAQRLFSRDIVQVLNEAPDRPWKELRRGKALTEMWLAMQLRAYGIRPRTLWIGSEAAKGYEREDFEDAFSRYALNAERGTRNRDQECLTIPPLIREWAGRSEARTRRARRKGERIRREEGPRITRMMRMEETMRFKNDTIRMNGLERIDNASTRTLSVSTRIAKCPLLGRCEE